MEREIQFFKNISNNGSFSPGALTNISSCSYCTPNDG